MTYSQAYNLKDRFAANLKSTVYTFKGFEGPSWLLDMEAPRASMEPDPVGVQAVMANSQHHQVATFSTCSHSWFITRHNGHTSI